MPNDVKNTEKMDPMEAELLKAFHRLEKTTEVKFARLETKIDDSVNGRFKDNERRIKNLEDNQKWIVFAIIGAVVGAVIKLVLN